MAVRWSELESARFGLRIGRDDGDGPIGLAELAPYDVVISRRPAESVREWSTLATLTGYTAIHADSLVYWRWEDDGGDIDVPDPWHMSHDRAHLERLVRDVFDGYGNHYASNPLFGRDDILDGYVEWALASAADGGFVEVVDDRGDAAGFGLVDWSAAEPDVRLAGVCRAARGSGRYRSVVAAMVAATRARGHAGIRISTQVHNVAVQRVWAAAGWKPFQAFETTHIVRSTLLAGAARITQEQESA